MSITGNLNIFPFSLTGLQNVDGTINGQTPINEIIITGQTSFLSVSPVDVNGDVDLDLHIPDATASIKGLLTSTDWTTFNNKQDTISSYAPIDFSSNIVSIPVANATTDGYLSSADWIAFSSSSAGLLLSNNSWLGQNTFNNQTFMDLSNTNTGYYLSYNPSTKLISYDLSSTFNILPLNNLFTGSNQFNGDVNINGNNLYINNLTDYYSLGRTPFQFTYPVLTSPNKAYYLTSQDQNYFSKIPIDFNNANYSFDTTTKISYMSNGFIYTSNGMTANRTIFLPTSGSVANYYGKAFTGVFYIQRPNQAGTSSILIDRISSDPQTRVSLNGVNQSSFPITLSYETSYTITFSLVSLLTPTSGLWDLYYDIKADGQTSIPTLQLVLDVSNTSVGKNIDITNGTLFADSVITNNFGALLQPSVAVSSSLAMGANKEVIVDFSNNINPLIKTTTPNVNYYPESIYYNDNSNNNNSIIPPMCKGQKMTLINNGVIPIADWVQVGTTPPTSFPINLFKQMSDGNIWIASNNGSTSAEIHIYDSTNTTQLGTITFGGALEGITIINVMVEDQNSLDYIYIGGEFRTVNGNAQNQFCITRVVRSTFVEDVLFDSTTTEYGVDGTVFTIIQVNSDLYCGGEFHQLEPTATTAECFIRVGLCDASSGTQTYAQVGGGVSTAITKFSGYIDASGNPILVMVGAIDNVDIAGTPIPTSNIATYDISNLVWTATSGTVSFNDIINDIIPNTIPATNWIVVGLFTDYIRAVSLDLTTETAIAGITVSSPFYRNSITFQNPANCFAVDYFYEIDTIGFTGVQKAYTTITPTTQIMCSTDNLNGAIAISWFNSDDIYSYTTNSPPQDCDFSIDPAYIGAYFVYGNVNTYTTYNLTTKYTATMFIANDLSGTLFWTPLGQPQGSFS